MEEKKFSYPKTFLLGFGFFGVSVIWSVYNAYVPLMLDGKYGLSAGWIGFFMVLDNIAALLIQPPLGAFSDRLRSPMGRRLPFVLLGAPIGAIAFGFVHYGVRHPFVEHGLLAYADCGIDAGCNPFPLSFAGQWGDQLYGRPGGCFVVCSGRQIVCHESGLCILDGFRAGDHLIYAGADLHPRTA
jgi:hypothetical protein